MAKTELLLKLTLSKRVLAIGFSGNRKGLVIMLGNLVRTHGGNTTIGEYLKEKEVKNGKK